MKRTSGKIGGFGSVNTRGQRLLAFLCSLGLFVLAGSEAKARSPSVPKELKPWVDWVLESVPSHGCPVVNDSAVCVWPGQLELDLDDKGGKFEQRVVTDRQLLVALPGDRETWPQRVKRNLKDMAVLDQGGVPMVELEPGEHKLEGRFTWSRMPEVLPIPARTAVIELSLNGKRVPFPKRAEPGRLWLGQTTERVSDEPQSLELEVFRKIVDGVPLSVETRLVLRVAGPAREVSLGNPTLAETAPHMLTSPLPARLDPGGVLSLQVRAGTHVVQVFSHSVGLPESMSLRTLPELWPSEETWVFEAAPDVRDVALSGAAAVDPTRTNLPEEWRSLPAFRVRQNQKLVLKTTRRGQADPPPNRMNLTRRLWLDADGKSYTVEDSIDAELHRGFRLDLTAAKLGSVEVNGEPQLITKHPDTGATGVELRNTQVSLLGQFRLPATLELPAVGWSEDVRSLSATLELPPGWDLLTATGVDSVSDTWLSHWDLWGFFFVLVLALVVARLQNPKWGFLALVTLVLLHDRPGAPMNVWVALLACWALLLVVPTGRVRNLLRAAFYVAALVLVVVAVTFSTAELRHALYPQLDQDKSFFASAEPVAAIGQGLASRELAVKQKPKAAMEAAPEEDVEEEAEEKPPAPSAQRLSRGASGGFGRGMLEAASAAPAPEPEQKADQVSPSQLKQDPNLVIQTGPAVPNWSFRSWKLGWSGPVDRDHKLELYLIPPWANLLLSLLRVGLLVVLGFVVLGRTPRGAGPPSRGPKFPPAPGRKPRGKPPTEGSTEAKPAPKTASVSKVIAASDKSPPPKAAEAKPSGSERPGGPGTTSVSKVLEGSEKPAAPRPSAAPKPAASARPESGRPSSPSKSSLLPKSWTASTPAPPKSSVSPPATSKPPSAAPKTSSPPKVPPPLPSSPRSSAPPKSLPKVPPPPGSSPKSSERPSKPPSPKKFSVQSWLTDPVFACRRSLGRWLLRLGPALLCLSYAGPVSAQAPRRELLDELRERLTRPAACEPDCVSVSRAELEVDDDELQVTLEVHVGTLTSFALPGPASSWVPDRLWVDRKSTDAMALLDDGHLHVRLTPGEHRVAFEGPLSGDELTLSFKSPPKVLETKADDWEFSGLDSEGRLKGPLQVRRKLKAGEAARDQGSDGQRQIVLPPWFELERRIELGLNWSIVSTLRRVSPAGSPVLVQVPLLPGESVTEAGVSVEAGKLNVSFDRDATEQSWTSSLKTSDKLTLTAPKDVPWTERWLLSCGVTWRCVPDGLSPVSHEQAGQWQPRYLPWPGEALSVKLNKPKSAAGGSKTIDAVELDVTAGSRLLNAKLELRLRTTTTDSHSVMLPEGARVQRVEFDGSERPTAAHGRKVTLSLPPGDHKLEVEWQQPGGIGLMQHAPFVDVGARVANVRTLLRLPPDRWLLWAHGPGWGPAILFWPYLILVLLVAGLLGRAPHSPLKTAQWALLGLGLTQVPVPAALTIIAWFFLLVLRRRVQPERASIHDALQVATVVGTAIALPLLATAVYEGLVVRPDMQVSGNGSTSASLIWFSDHADQVLPTAWVLSVPLWIYRVLMLMWALWLAYNLLRWLRWGWSCFAKGPLWRPLGLKKLLSQGRYRPQPAGAAAGTAAAAGSAGPTGAKASPGGTTKKPG